MSGIASLIALPFKLVWELIAFLFKLGGRALVITLGLVFMLVGGILTATVLAAPIGIPLAVFGFALVLRGLF